MLQGRKFGYEYDNRGNRTRTYLSADQSKRWEFDWDGENKLTQAKLINGTVTLRTLNFKYDPFGRRIEKQVVDTLSTTTTRYIHDREDIVLQLVDDGTTSVMSRYVHGPGIDEPLALVKNGQSYYYHADGQGSVLALSDSSNSIIQRYKYDSFGALTAIQDTEFGNAYTYTGRE